jgi:FAD/FMN-containing dehydrogenase
MDIGHDRIGLARRALEKQLAIGKIVSEGPMYERACNIWNPSARHHPPLIILCENVSDVQVVVKSAASCGVSLSVRAGGHGWTGRSLRGDIVLDLSRMHEVSISGDRAFLGGGALQRDVANAAQRYGLVNVGGIFGALGQTAVATGGGYGHFTSNHGMACDNILGAEVVLPDGSIVRANDRENEDLLWALRGGGGNFGVVTKLEILLHHHSDMLGGVVSFKWNQARAVLEAYNDLVSDIPDGLTMRPMLLPSPDGTLCIAFHVAWSGPQADDRRITKIISELGTDADIKLARKTLCEHLEDVDRMDPGGVSRLVRTVTLPGFTSDAAGILIEAMQQRSSPLSWIAAHPFHGQAERVPLEATAFGIRSGHFVVGIYTGWIDGPDDAHRAWARQLEDALKPFALPSVYLNYVGDDRHKQVAGAYGPNLERLLAIKRQFDPNGVFSAQPLPGAQSSVRG